MNSSKRKRIEERLKLYKDRYDLLIEAEKAILGGAQSYTIGSRTLTRAELAEVRKLINDVENGIDEMEAQLESGARRKAVRAIPRDV